VIVRSRRLSNRGVRPLKLIVRSHRSENRGYLWGYADSPTERFRVGPYRSLRGSFSDSKGGLVALRLVSAIAGRYLGAAGFY